MSTEGTSRGVALTAASRTFVELYIQALDLELSVLEHLKDTDDKMSAVTAAQQFRSTLRILQSPGLTENSFPAIKSSYVSQRDLCEYWLGYMPTKFAQSRANWKEESFEVETGEIKEEILEKTKNRNRHFRDVKAALTAAGGGSGVKMEYSTPAEAL